jgi:hypothetical protein
MRHLMAEAHWLIADHNWDSLSFVRLVGVMRLRAAGPEVEEEAAAVAGAVELADSDSGSGGDFGTLEKEIGHDAGQDLLEEALLGMPSCALGEGSWEVDQRVEGQEGGALSLLDQMGLTAEVVLESESPPDDDCSRMQEEQVLGWFARLDEHPIADLAVHLRARAGRLEDGCPVGLAHCFDLACRSPGHSGVAGGVP